MKHNCLKMQWIESKMLTRKHSKYYNNFFFMILKTSTNITITKVFYYFIQLILKNFKIVKKH